MENENVKEETKEKRPKKKKRNSGIGGQAVLEGVMMKNKDRYAVAVRKPDGQIDVKVSEYGSAEQSGARKIPFIRGVFNFYDALVLGTRSLNYSASFYEDDDKEKTGADKAVDKVSNDHSEAVFSVLTVIFSLVIAIAVFIVLPYYLAVLLDKVVRNESLLAFFEALIRIIIFLIYVAVIGNMKDIRRVYMYHGAEHKCINCIEKGRDLNVKNVKRSSRFHKRCGTSFLLFVVFLSAVLFFFIRVSNPILRIVIRIALIPVIAGIAYEIIRWAGNSDNLFVTIISAPGKLLQKLTTKEPDDDMIEVAIASIEAVFDWKQYFKDEFDYDVDDANEVMDVMSMADEYYGDTDEAEEAEAPAEEYAEDAPEEYAEEAPAEEYSEDTEAYEEEAEAGEHAEDEVAAQEAEEEYAEDEISEEIAEEEGVISDDADMKKALAEVAEEESEEDDI